MALGTTLNPTSGQAPDQAAAKMPLAPFVRAAREHTEEIITRNGVAVGSEVVVGTFDVNAFGFLRSLVVEAEITGGTGSAAVLQADAPWSLLHNVTLQDVNGASIVNLSGYQLYMANKWGGFAGRPDPALLPTFTQIGTNGNGKFQFRVPLEIGSRDGLGSLPNQNAASTYKLRITQAATAAVFSTPPGGAPVVRWRVIGEYWTQPGPVTAAGSPVAQTPPVMGTTAYQSFLTKTINSGSNRFQVDRVGNYIRSLTLIGRTTAGARSNTVLPDWIEQTIDGKSLLRHPSDLQRQYMYERSGNTIDTGVLVLDYCHDFDGVIGGEMRDQWLPTTQATRLEFVGNSAAAGTIEIIVNDIAIPAGAGSPFITGGGM